MIHYAEDSQFIGLLMLLLTLVVKLDFGQEMYNHVVVFLLLVLLS
jgi:hypothetical protein